MKFVIAVFFYDMIDSQVKHVNKAIKLNLHELLRIKARVEDNNRCIKNFLRSNSSKQNESEIKELLSCNRFLFQKQFEKQVEKQNLENAFKSLLLAEMDNEEGLIESERRMDYFRMTVNKSLEFNKNHPYFNDPTFLTELIAEFESREDFEACAELSGLLT